MSHHGECQSRESLVRNIIGAEVKIRQGGSFLEPTGVRVSDNEGEEIRTSME
jgi:hypothetical protein